MQSRFAAALLALGLAACAFVVHAQQSSPVESVLNALTFEVYRELTDTFAALSAEESVRAVVITGAGRAFCAGMDLSVDGNVFGLNESLRPTPSELRKHLTDQPYHDGVRDTGARAGTRVTSRSRNRDGTVTTSARDCVA